MSVGRILNLWDGNRKPRRVENDSRGTLTVYFGIYRLATLAAGESATFVPNEVGLGFRLDEPPPN